jgi:hypothetical protein
METLHYAVEVAVSVLLIVAVSEIAKRHSIFAALVASLPIVSILAMMWVDLFQRSTIHGLTLYSGYRMISPGPTCESY